MLFLNYLNLTRPEVSTSTAHLRNQLIILGWEFINKLNISSPFSLDRFFLTQQLICKNQSQIKKHNVMPDNFVSEISIAKNLHLPGERTLLPT